MPDQQEDHFGENRPLFQTGDFTLASGVKSSWKIECDALTEADWAGLAAIAVTFLPPFHAVEGVPTGGAPFATALAPYRTNHGLLLIADDVWTTGGSMHRFAEQQRQAWFGVVAFARNVPDYYVKAIFTMPKAVQSGRNDPHA